MLSCDALERKTIKVTEISVVGKGMELALGEVGLTLTHVMSPPNKRAALRT